MLRHVCIILLCATTANAGDVWLFLKDGTVCLADSADATSATLENGKQITLTPDQIYGHRTRLQIEQAVDAMLVEIAQCKNMDEHARRFKVFKHSAVPRLLQHLDQQIGPRKLPVLYALQFSWAPQAYEPVLKLTKDPDPDIVIGALTVLINTYPPGKLNETLKAAADHKDIKVASMVFQFAEPYNQDTTLKRVRRVMADANGRKSAITALSHYFVPDLTAPTASLLKTSAAREKSLIVAALIAQSAQTEEIRTQIAGLLTAREPEAREAAAEYYTWLGRSDDLSAINTALEGEKDIYTRAALQGAVRTIGLRGAIKLRAGQSTVDSSSKDDSTYQKFISTLNSAPTAGDWAAAREFLAKADDYEPFFGVSGKAEADNRFRLRTLLQQRVYAAPCGVLDDSAVSKFLDEKEIPPTAKLVPPIRDYFDPKRKNFGHLIDASNPRFGNSVHVGDDCGWENEFRTVVSIAPGVVRLVDYIPSWGHIVVLEHTMDGKPFCSLYGHLSPMIHVKPGDVVEAGQKIGAIGRGYSMDNGNYFAHLHFGIHRGPYSTEIRWICGYVSPEAFATGSHGWVDPQEFLKK